MPDDTTNNNSDQKGTDPTKTDAGAQSFDPTKLSNEDFEKIFDDPRLFQHRRFKELNEAASAGKEATKKLEQAEKERLESEGKFKELAEKEQKRAEELEAQLKTEKINSVLRSEASKAGAIDLDTVLKLVDQNAVSVDANGNVVGADTAVKSLLESKPFLKGAGSQGTPTIGGGTNPSTSSTGANKFTLSQIQDPEFYREHRPEILVAQRTGNIIDDQAQGNTGPMGNQG